MKSIMQYVFLSVFICGASKAMETTNKVDATQKSSFEKGKFSETKYNKRAEEEENEKYMREKRRLSEHFSKRFFEVRQGIEK